MRYGLLLGMALVLSMSLTAVGSSVTESADSIIIGNAICVPGQSQVSVPVYFVTHGDITHYNLPLVIESAGDILFVGHEVESDLEGWDEHWQGLKSDQRQAVELGFSDLGGDDNPSLNTNGQRVEALRLIFAVVNHPETQDAPIRARIDEHSGAPIFGYSDGITGVAPVIVDGSVVLSSEGAPNEAPLPNAITLSQNYPNPFNPTTEIEFALPEAAAVRLTVFNVLGQTVRNLISGTQEAGYHRIVWNGNDNSGRQVPSGTYFYRLEAGDFSEAMKMVMLK
jgi:hypothetical protein